MSAPTLETTEPVVTDTAPQPVAARRHLPLIAAGVAIAVLVAAWLASPRLASFSPAGDVTVTDAGWVTLPRFEGGMELVKYEHGEHATIAIPVLNDGPLPVTVTGVSLTGENAPMLEVVDGVDVSFELGSGEVGELVLLARFDNCKYYTERAIDLYPAATILFDMLGRSGSAELVLDRRLAVRSPTIVDCPDRTMDRSYNRRNP